MPRYQLLETTLIGNTLVEPGEIEFDGIPTAIFVPLDDEGKDAQTAYFASVVARDKANELERAKQAISQIDPQLMATIREVIKLELADDKPSGAALLGLKPGAQRPKGKLVSTSDLA